jgi:hypothetical protein
MILILMAAN